MSGTLISRYMMAKKAVLRYVLILIAKEHLPNYLGNDAKELQNILLQFHIPKDEIQI